MTWTDGNSVTHKIRQTKDRVVIKTGDYNTWETVVLRPLTVCGIHGNDETGPRRAVDCMTCIVKGAS